jgi:regulator of sigma E protease
MVLIAGATMTQLNSDPGKVLAVVKSSPAAQAGLLPGDHIATVDGKAITSPENIQQDEVAASGRSVVVTGTHADGRPFSVEVTPKCSGNACQMGVGIARITTPLTAVQDGVVFPWQAFQVIVQGLGALATGQVQGGLFGRNGLTGPIGIAAITADAVNAGPPAYVTLVALLSVALGVTNLLPLLALDGGRIVVVAVEWLRRRPFDRNTELNFQRWGLAALLALAAIISFLDIQRLASGQFPGVG